MLAYVLALVIGLGSFAFYMAAFFVPEVHRKSDFYLSGGGLFYALVLWVCAGRITGWVLLSQIASVSLLCWLGWQTLTLRRVLTSPEQQTPIPSQDELAPKFQGVLQPVTNLLGNLLGKSKPAIPTPKAPVGTSQDTTIAEKQPVPEEVHETAEIEVPEEEETTVEPSPEAVAEVEQQPEVPEEEEITVEPSPETVAEVEQEPEIFTEEEETTLESSPEAMMEASKPPSTLTASEEQSRQNFSSTEKQGLVQQVTGLFKGFLGKSKPATPIPQTPLDEQREQESRGRENTNEPSSITPIVDDTEISEPAEPIAAESSEAEISETVELIATESSEVDTSESLEPIPPKPPLPELLEDQEKSASSDASKSEKKAKIKIEEIAPEVELAPPAEPLGDGDPEVRKIDS